MLLLILIACKGKDNNSDKEYVTATIDNVDYLFNDKVELSATSEYSHVINGRNKALGARITLGLNLDENETGAFELDNNIVLVYHANIMLYNKKLYHNWNAKKSFPGSSGKITITKNTATYLEGVFLFEGVGATKIDRSIKKVTKGKFRILK